MALRTFRLAPTLRVALKHEWRRLRSDMKEPCPSCPPPAAPPACRSPPAVHPVPAQRVTCCARPRRVDCDTRCSDDKTSNKKTARSKHSAEEQKKHSSPSTKTAAGSTESAASSDCVDHIPDSRCQIRKTGGINPCAHKPRVILTIDRSENCKETKDQNCTSEPVSSPKSGKNTLTKRSSEHKPKLRAANLQADNVTNNSCDTKTCKKTDDQSWCKTVPVPPKIESKHCPPLTFAQKILKARQKLGCITNKKKYHTSSCRCAKSLDTILKERSQLKEAGRGREVFPGRCEAEVGRATELLRPGASALYGTARFTVEIKLRPEAESQQTQHKLETKTSTCSLTSLKSNEKLKGNTHHHSSPGGCQTSISKTCRNPKLSSAQDETHKHSPKVPRSWISYQGIKNCLGLFSNESETLKAPDTQQKSESSKCKAQPAPPGAELPFPPRSPPYPCGPSATDPPFTAPDACNRENKHRVAPASITLCSETSSNHTQCDAPTNEKSKTALRQAQQAHTNKRTCAWREDCPKPKAKPSAPEGPLCPDHTQIDKFVELSFSKQRPFFYFSKRIV